MLERDARLIDAVRAKVRRAEAESRETVLARPGSPNHSSAPMAVRSVSRHPHVGPKLGFTGLDVLWIQVTGTVCNIACLHCFITCGPKNESHPVMSKRAILDAIDAGARAGVKEYYFTGGEPFLHPDIVEVSERALSYGPLSILTNAIILTRELARELARLSAESPYSFDLRVSLDGVSKEENDPIRGRGTFDRIVAGARHLLDAGLNPVFTVTTVYAKYQDGAGRTRFMERLVEQGFPRPRVKFIPPFNLGREVRRSHGYGDQERLPEGGLFEGEEDVLQCASSRTVTARGVYPCPILIDAEGARLSGQLEESFGPIRLNHPACVTCHVEGFTCRT